jgi:glucose/arabinose dehydrogenase
MRRTWISALLVVAVGCTAEAAPAPTTLPAVTTITTPEPQLEVESSDQPPESTTLPSATTTTIPLDPLLGIGVELVTEGLKRPVLVLSPPDDVRRFVVLQGGKIVIMNQDGLVRSEPFLDISDLVNDNSIEQGLLGVAFHPTYAQNGRLFVYYTQANNNSILVEYHASGDPDRVNLGSATEMLEIEQPTERHNAGMLLFGPRGYLWMSLGEGGAASVNAQDSDTLLGTMVRLDVDSEAPYAIPSDNPFVDGAAPEVWAIGLRNPWRFWIDASTEMLYIGDVGQGNWEEINVVSIDAAGSNFGWLPMEGTRCFLSGCDASLYDLPIVEYPHSEGCSIVGGVVYRGEAIPELSGDFFYSDWCQGWLRSFAFGSPDINEWDVGELGQVTSFGTDASGEVYITTWSGEVYKLVPLR